jgi:hypothetical protein
MSVRDSRGAPFVWAATDALAHIRGVWQGGLVKTSAWVEARIGLAVYHALTEIANDDRARTAIHGDSDRFQTSHNEIADRAVVSSKSAARACAELERIGLVVIEADRDGANRPGRPSFYALVEPFDTWEDSSYLRPSRRRKPVQTPSEAISDVLGQRRKPLPTSLYRGKKNRKNEEGAGGHRAAAAWSAAKKLLAGRLSSETFDRYIVPLECAGVRDGLLVLVDASEQGGGEWIQRIARPMILEALEHFDDFEIVDESVVESRAPSPALVRPLASAPTHIREAYPQVAEHLGRICEVKQCPFPQEPRVVAAMETYPDADHRAVAADMADWLLEGTGRGREVRDVIADFRSQLNRKQHSASGGVPTGRAAGSADLAEYDQVVVRSG